jgi:hypothetical protein
MIMFLAAISTCLIVLGTALPAVAMGGGGCGPLAMAALCAISATTTGRGPLTANRVLAMGDGAGQ